MTEPIVVEFEVSALPEKAFRVWTERCSSWWPPSHIMSQDDEFEVVFEPEAGGRIYEKAADGTEYEWGQVLVWDPPGRLEYRWHIFLEPEKATRVTITFEEGGRGSVVRLVNDGFEVFGDSAAERLGRVHGAWTSIVGKFAAKVAQ